MPERPRMPAEDEVRRDIELRRANEEWLDRHREELLDEYAGKYVAVFDERVVAEDPDFVRLLARLGKEHPSMDPSVAAIRFLSTPALTRRVR